MSNPSQPSSYEPNPYESGQVFSKNDEVRHRPTRGLTIAATLLTLGALMGTLAGQTYARIAYESLEFELPQATILWLTPVPLVALCLLLSFIILKEVVIDSWSKRQSWNIVLMLLVTVLIGAGLIFLGLPLFQVWRALAV